MGLVFSQPPSPVPTKLLPTPPSAVRTRPVPRLPPTVWLATLLVQPVHVAYWKPPYDSRKLRVTGLLLPGPPLPRSTQAPAAGMGALTAAWSTSQSVQKWLPVKAALQVAWAPLRPPRLPP